MQTIPYPNFRLMNILPILNLALIVLRVFEFTVMKATWKKSNHFNENKLGNT